MGWSFGGVPRGPPSVIGVTGLNGVRNGQIRLSWGVDKLEDKVEGRRGTSDIVPERLSK